MSHGNRATHSVTEWAAEVASWLCFHLLLCFHYQHCAGSKGFWGFVSSSAVLSIFNKTWIGNHLQSGVMDSTNHLSVGKTDDSSVKRLILWEQITCVHTHTIVHTMGYHYNCSQPAMFSSSVHVTAHDRAKHTCGALTFSPSHTLTHTQTFFLRETPAGACRVWRYHDNGIYRCGIAESTVRE